MMSEPVPQNGPDPTSDMQVDEADKTHPNEEILKTLQQLTNSQQQQQQPPPPSALSQPSQSDMSQSVATETQQEVSAHSEWDVLRAQVKEKPTDVDAWLKLVDVAEESGNFDRVNETYEALLEAYPNTVCHSLVNS